MFLMLLFPSSHLVLCALLLACLNLLDLISDWMPGCKDENAELCTVDGQFGGKYGGDTQNTAVFLAELGIGITCAICTAIFSCGICPCACFKGEPVYLHLAVIEK